MFPLEDDSWKAVRRFVVATDVLDLPSGSFTLGEVITEGLVAGKIGGLISRGTIRETDHDLSQVNETPREDGRS